MRTEINYKKEGFSQIFPVLYITNDKEKAWVFGFGKNNIAFVSGENDDYKERKELLKNNPDILSNFNEKGFNKLSSNHKAMILAVGLVAFGAIFYYYFRKRK